MKVFVTGAGGFIGGRLVEILKESEKAEVHVLLRSIGKAARISKYSLAFFKGDITSREAVEKAMEGCDVVVHCAHDFSRQENNTKAAAIIAEASLKQGVKKFVYISSFAVHKTASGPELHEDSPLNNDWDYAVSKTQIENQFLSYYQKNNLPVVILRPTIVYGPFAGAWSIGVVNEMLENRLVIPYAGERICNTVYVDDVVQAIIKAIQADARCHGQAYLVSGPDAVTWNEFYKTYQQNLSLQEPVLLSAGESEKLYQSFTQSKPVAPKNSLSKDPITFLKKTPVYKLYQGLLKNEFLKSSLLSAKKNIPRPLVYPSKESFETLACTGKVSLEKATRELDYRPEYSFQKGMDKTISFLKWANLNCD
jgi:nucleoside-diphosphate-sugar epimerase